MLLHNAVFFKQNFCFNLQRIFICNLVESIQIEIEVGYIVVHFR